MLWLLNRLPPDARTSVIYDADEYLPSWLYSRYHGFGSRLMTAYHRDQSAKSTGCPVCGADRRLAGKRPEGGFRIVCDNGHDVSG